ncbi:fatty acyl-AMP ligase [Pararhizobium mangrovi]|uniref:Fatty acyl-AMP ligase n=1 Tax=Pararhizobium mangrovi TaxID=2590452 RepID=A0A506UA04_9HYPH|nr:fatty acyl-AMP ligase [Pararhizobium mangrovi]TPW29931.1 fatty acyl-AMP ligase [Pararhizobium mangrovi]
MDLQSFPKARTGLTRAIGATLPEALDAAARTERGFHFYSGRGKLNESLSYASLRTEALALAHQLLTTGLKPGDRVALVAETDANFVRAFFACQYAGLVPVPMPLPTAFAGKQVYLEQARRMIEQADAAGAFAPESLAPWLVEGLVDRDMAIVGTLDDLPPAADGISLPNAAPDDLSYLQFSSGSTRFPTGVAVTQAALMANAEGIIRHGLAIGDDDRCVSWLPFYHDMGLVGFVLTPLIAGLDCDYLATRDFARRPLLWLDLISRNGGTISYSPSFGYDLCTRRAASAPIDGIDLSRWRAAGIGGDMIRPDVLERFTETFAPAGFSASSFVASYGMAEASLALSFAPLDAGIRVEAVDRTALEDHRVLPGIDGHARRFVRCGPPLPGHAIEIRDTDGASLEGGAIGRIHARGPSLMKGYYRNHEATRAVLAEDGWLDTGDLGYFAGEEIVVTGRAKDLMIVNGRNIWPQDLEWTTEAEVAGLKSGDVAVFSYEDETGERPIAMVECRASEPTARAELAEAVANTLRSRHGVVVEAVLVKPRALPVTSSGKLSRAGARELFRRMQAEQTAGAVG